MLRYLEEKEKNKSRKLWEEAFEEDSGSFVDYYYKEKTRDNRILVMEQEGRIVSMLHRNPYTLWVKGKIWNCDYIVGVATEKASRRKGYMRKLMERSLRDMKEEKMPFCFLMPAFEALYLPFAFTYVYRSQRWKLNHKGCKELKSVGFTPEDAERLALWWEQWLRSRFELYAVRDIAYVERLQKELQSENGCIEILEENGRPGKVAGIKADWGIEKPEQRMLFCDEAYVRKQEKPAPCMMGRIVDLPVFMEAVCLEAGDAEQLEVLLAVEDTVLPDNAGVWRWRLDKTSSRIEKMQKGIQETIQPDLKLTIGELTAWLTGYELPENAKPYEKLIRPVQGICLDEVV